MKNILNTIVLLEIISVMCVRHTASFKRNLSSRILHKSLSTYSLTLTKDFKGKIGQ